ncbi:hypothetical protein KY285_036229 [Solanum tuberosum]|nr:hypothetical protein KY285_036229 [Solanum tuberosum]
MTRTRLMASWKTASPSSSFEVDIISLSSDSSESRISPSPSSSKKRASSSKQKSSKKPRHLVTGSLSPKDMHRLWGIECKIRYDNFKTHPIVPDCDINLINDLLFEDVFGTKFSGVIPYMNGIWPDDFEVSLEGSKRAVVEPDSDLSDFGRLSLCFEHRILTHIVATSLIPRKGYLSNISTRDVFILYCLLRKYHINWVEWFKEYMWESVEDPNPSANLPYRLLISRILVDCLVDISMFTPIVINATYDSRTFSSRGYMRVENKWIKKDSVKAIAETSKPTKISTDSAALLIQDNDELKTMIFGVECGLETLYDAIKKEGISTVNKLIRQVDFLKGGVSSSNNDPVVTIQTSYSSLSRSVEWSYNSFCGKVINTLKYFLGDR